MKHFTILLCSLFVLSCASAPKGTPLERKMNQYLGQSKADIMLVYGSFPVKDGYIDGLGKALVYSELKNSGFGVYASQYYRHTMFLFDPDNKCRAWSVRNEPVPFDRVDIRVFKTPTF